MRGCDALKLEAEQMRISTVLEHTLLESRKKEELRRITIEFDRLAHMLMQRKVYLLTQLSTAFDALIKNQVSDIGTAESQEEYSQHLLEKMKAFYDGHFREVGEVVKGQEDGKREREAGKRFDIVRLNVEANEILPRLEKELDDLRQSFYRFSYADFSYPQFKFKRTSPRPPE